MLRSIAIIAVLFTTGLVGGCARDTSAQDQSPTTGAMPQVDRAVAVLHPTQGNNTSGVVHFVRQGQQVRIIAEVRGLTPNSQHGFHVHQYGDCTASDASSAGGHFDPEGHDHSLPPGSPRHVGDLGNIEADAQGVARKEITVDNMTLAGAANSVLGRAVIVHAQRDTGKGESGEAGARIACGVIGIANPQQTGK